MPMTPTENTTVLGRSIEIRGELSGDAGLSVEGLVEGVIRLEGAQLVVRPEGRIRASILAQDVLVFGRIEGEIRATGRVDLRSGSLVAGAIYAARIVIEDGAVLRCRLDPARATEPLPSTLQPADRQLALPNQPAPAKS